METRLLIADDYDIVRQGVRAFLGDAPDLVVVGEARDGAEALRLARRLRPEVIVMDLRMPELDGLSATRILQQEVPESRVVVFTASSDVAVSEVLRAGAVGFVCKDERLEDLERAIRAAAVGQTFVGPRAAMGLVSELQSREQPDLLSDREIDVLRFVASGSTNKEIARELGIAEKTVKTHVSNILDKLGMQSRTQAAVHALQTGLLSSTRVSGLSGVAA
jgi:two-component system, NarL family, response regulator LiaR